VGGLEIIAVLLGQLFSQVLFVNMVSTQSLIMVQWTYLAIALLTILLMLFFYYLPLPKVSDSDLQIQAERLGINPLQKYFGRLPIIFTTLTITVVLIAFLNRA
jgi:fucose permease